MLRRACALALAALVLGLPFELYFLERQQSLATSLKLQLLVFVALWLAWLVERARWAGPDAVARELARLLPRRFAGALAAFVAVEALAAALAPELRRNAAVAAAKWLVGSAVLIGVCDLARSAGPRVGRLVMTALATAGALTSLLGVGDRLGLRMCRRVIELFQPYTYWSANLPRLSSTMEYPTTAASFLVSALLATVALLIRETGTERSRLWPGLLSAAALVEAAALALTFSRGAVVAAAAALVAGAVLGARPRQFPIWKYAAAAVVASFGLVQVMHLYLGSGEPPPHLYNSQRRIARFGGAANEEVRYLEPAREYRESISVRNDSSSVWRRAGFGVGYRWYRISSGESSPLEQSGVFRDDLAPGGERRLEVDLRTPAGEGEYLLIWFVVHRDPRLEPLPWSFSPATLCSIRSDASPPGRWSARTLDYLETIRRERRELPLEVVPSRSDLWRAALRMFAAHPLLGVGPDNFRLLKWKYMDVPKGDETILANSLYLEFLAGGGIAGFAAFAWLMIELGRAVLRRTASASGLEERQLSWFGVAFLAAFLAHGAVDYFLKFTPTFLLFWIVAGLQAAGGHGIANQPLGSKVRSASGGSDADRL
jgi:hypothetical protein